jgi:hypothetical protein
MELKRIYIFVFLRGGYVMDYLSLLKCMNNHNRDRMKNSNSLNFGDGGH